MSVGAADFDNTQTCPTDCSGRDEGGQDQRRIPRMRRDFGFTGAASANTLASNKAE